MLITTIPQYIQNITNAKADLTANRLHVVASVQEFAQNRNTTSGI